MCLSVLEVTSECEMMKTGVWILNLGVWDVALGGRGYRWSWHCRVRMGEIGSLICLKASLQIADE